MSCLAKVWRAALCSHLIRLIAISGLGLTAFAQEQPDEGGESDHFLLNKHDEGVDYSLRKVIPIEFLPERIAFKKGRISLIPDPTDRSRRLSSNDKPYMVVYLVNDTDEPIPKAIGELRDVDGEVCVGGRWYPREKTIADCGTVAPPQDLPPHQALAIGAISSDFGDCIGDIRYTFSISDRLVVSEPMRGRYFIRQLREIMASEERESSLGEVLDDGLLRNQWNQNMLARNPEEFCALLELVRHFQLASSDRARILEWMLQRAEKQDATADQRKAIERLKVILSEPWMVDKDGQSLADRSLVALEAQASGGYGEPEKFKTCVWRYLDGNILGVRDGFFGNRNGFPLKPADGPTVLRLIRVAIRSLDSPDLQLADSAAAFLGNCDVSEDLFPSSEFVRFLESERTSRVWAGLSGLLRRNRAQDLGGWLLGRFEKNDANTINYYRLIQNHLFGEMPDWERSLLIRSFKKDPLSILAVVSSGSIDRREKLPQESISDLRIFLNSQLSTEKKQWWNDRAEKAKTSPSDYSILSDCRALSKGIDLLHSLNDPADVELLKAFLDHPAASASFYPNGKGILSYTARQAAINCLSRRGIRVSDSLVTQIEFWLPPPNLKTVVDSEPFAVRFRFQLIGLLASLLFAMTMVLLWRQKHRRRRT